MGLAHSLALLCHFVAQASCLCGQRASSLLLRVLSSLEGRMPRSLEDCATLLPRSVLKSVIPLSPIQGHFWSALRHL